MLLDKYQDTVAWDNEVQLPYFPDTNNGHVYFAYILRAERPDPKDPELRDRILSVAQKTLFGRKRWKSDIPLSHDEVRGWAFTGWYMQMPELNEEIYWELEVFGGNMEETKDQGIKANLFRLPDMEAQIKAARGNIPTPLEQAAYAASKIHQAFTVKKGEASGLLRTWLYAPLMMNFPVCAAALMVWNLVLKRRGFKLEDCLSLEPRLEKLTAAAKGRGFLD